MPHNHGHSHPHVHLYDHEGNEYEKIIWKSKHEHQFGNNATKTNETKTLIVVILTAVTMVVEIVAGLAFNSMALLADGLHMGSHTLALGIAAFAYNYARKHSLDPKFSFGTGKVGILAAYTGAVLLGVFALGMVFESIEKLISPEAIVINQALIVATLGLIVNAISAFVLGGGHDHGHLHDHNMKSAYLHVLADALTSVLAIIALLAAKYTEAVWLDPMMGILGAILITRWAISLLKSTFNILLDNQISKENLELIKKTYEALPETTVADLHMWAIGSEQYSLILSIQAKNPLELNKYRDMIPVGLGIVHVTIEVSKN